MLTTHMFAAPECPIELLFVLQLESLSGSGVGQRTDSMFASDDGQQQNTVDQLELQFYETQLELYDAKLEILKNEELLLVAQMDALRRQIKGRFYTTRSSVDVEATSDLWSESVLLTVHPETLKRRLVRPK